MILVSTFAKQCESEKHFALPSSLPCRSTQMGHDHIWPQALKVNSCFFFFPFFPLFKKIKSSHTQTTRDKQLGIQPT